MNVLSNVDLNLEAVVHPIDEAAEIVGSQEALGHELGVSKSAVNQWKLPGRKVPADKCPAIERLTAGKVRCEKLRPDVDWAYLREAAGGTANVATER
jgi:DNA-binding transcriptional regulator YdaS (Cro superfamily)